VSDLRQSDYNSQLSSLELTFRSMIVSDDKRINNSIHYLDVSSTSSMMATKHGNNHVKVWSLATGEMQSSIKFSSYTEAQSRSRDYLIRSHSILSETSRLIAIATRFGRSIEIWNWEKKKCLQTIDNADRWSVGKMEIYDHGWGRLAAYRGETNRIDLFAATREKKPFVLIKMIDLAEANLPFIPQYPELALSPTSPLIVAAAGPRPPRRGHPPPDKETLLVAWETHDNGLVGSKPYRVARPWQHKEIDTAIPSDLTTYGSVVVSIWIPATFRAVLAPSSQSYNLTPVKVPSRFVLVWDLAANSTRTFAIPNCTSCISPDCRYVAYCHASGAAIGARGTVAVIDVMSSQEVWCWPDRNATAMDSGPRVGLKQFEDLARVTELAFSADSKSLIVGDSEGRVGVYDFEERAAEHGPGNVAMAY
jgi:WD40 repeat protein